MLKIFFRLILVIFLLSMHLYGEINIQKNIYDAAEEMIRYDEKMNRAIAAHNQVPYEKLELTTINDFEETKDGYLLEQTIKNPSQTKVKVSIEKGLLIISTKIENKDFFNTEFNNSEITTIESMSISLIIPHNANKNKIKKNYKNGILRVEFPFK